MQCQRFIEEVTGMGGGRVVQKYYIVTLNNPAPPSLLQAPPHSFNPCAPVVKTLLQYSCDDSKITL